MYYDKKPWLKYYDGIPKTINYPKVSLYERVMQTVEEHPEAIAWDFMGNEQNYRTFGGEINAFANALTKIGMKQGDVITISMPTAPNGIVPVYAANKIGGVCSMIHPLSPAPQIKMYLNISKSKFALTLDIFYEEFKKIIKDTSVEKIIVAKATDYLTNPLLKFGYWLKKGRKVPPIPDDPNIYWYKDLLEGEHPEVKAAEVKADDLAIILYSGGTTGVPKGIKLSNYNMISQGMMVCAFGNLNHTQSVLAILPIFHGFGLGVCVNAAFMVGGKSILVPIFTPKTVAKLIKKKRPNFIIGVPTLFEALTHSKVFNKTDLNCLEAAYCGADTLPKKVKDEFERIVRENNGTVTLNEGYGLTEAVTAIMALPPNPDYYREGSIGIPFPDMMAKIVKRNSVEEADLGEEGEICVSGPAVMLGYLDNKEATEKALKKHDDGRIWLHTGDIGTMDKDGFFYFKLREKRMLKVSGINVYPKRVEETLRQHQAIEQVCVIGIPDKKQGSRVKAFVVLKDSNTQSDQTKNSIKKYGLKNLLKWESPREIEFRNELPTTLVGKIAWKELENEEIAKLKKGEVEV